MKTMQRKIEGFIDAFEIHGDACDALKALAHAYDVTLYVDARQDLCDAMKTTARALLTDNACEGLATLFGRPSLSDIVLEMAEDITRDCIANNMSEPSFDKCMELAELAIEEHDFSADVDDVANEIFEEAAAGIEDELS